MKRVWLLLAMTSACASSAAPAPAPVSPAGAGRNASVATAVPAKLDFIEDDYGRALADARAKKLPLFIESWAAWCHTCMSMRAYVFPDERLRRRAGEFVWLMIDVESEKNAAFVARFPTTVMPTLWVLDPETEKPALKWNGSATTQELTVLLDDAIAAVKNGDAGGEAGAALLRGNKATAAGKLDVAVAEFRAALAAAPAGWTKRGTAVEALTARLSELGQREACVDLALEEIPRLSPGTSLANVALAGLTASLDLPTSGEKRARLTREVRRIATDMTQPLLADDRSSLFDALVDATKHDDPEGAKRTAREWASFLEDQATRAPNAEARAVFDAHRLAAYIELGEVQAKALAMLLASERDFPGDYNPPARLARAYFELKRLDEAKASVDRALGLAYGPRKLRIFTLKADILGALHDVAGEKRALADALELAKTMPLSRGYARLRVTIEKRLQDLSR